MVGVVHRLSGALQSGRDTVDGQLHQSEDAVALGVVGSRAAAAGPAVAPAARKANPRRGYAARPIAAAPAHRRAADPVRSRG